VITNIGLDHTQFLGNTLDAIAEKAGIIKPNVPVVMENTLQKQTSFFDKAKNVMRRSILPLI
jgi:dihydrofolate synthase/folylpolyglutamate synthase